MVKDKKLIINRIRHQQAAQRKANVTFRFSVMLMDELRAHCEDAGVSMNSVLEELIKEYLGETH